MTIPRRAVPGLGESLADLHPNIAKEWHPQKNFHLGLGAGDVVPNSGIKVWWLCSEGHSWEARVFTRTRNKLTAQCRACACRDQDGSIIESNLRQVLGQDPKCLPLPDEKRIVLPTGKIVDVDIVGSYAGREFMVEYDGHRWHRTPDRRARDYRKTNALLNDGRILIRIRENGLCHLKLKHPNLLQINHRQSLEPDRVRFLAEQIWDALEFHRANGHFR